MYRRGKLEDYPQYIKGGDIVSFDIYPVVHSDKGVSCRLEYVPRGVERLVKWSKGEKIVWNCIEWTHINDLAGRDLTDLQAENEFRRAVGLSEVAEDRRPLSITHPTPMPAPSLPAHGPAVLGGQDPFARYLGSLEDHRSSILACVFRRFDLAVPPGESDAARHPELPAIKKALQARLVAQTACGSDAGKMEAGEVNSPVKELAGRGELWAEEAIVYLGLDRIELARPDMALQRLIKKGALRPTKIGRRLVFKKAELDLVLKSGDQSRRRARPRRNAK